MAQHGTEDIPPLRIPNAPEAVHDAVTAVQMDRKTSISRAGINTVANFVGSSVIQAAGIVFAIAYFRILGPRIMVWWDSQRP
jgi:hypothetical protein